MTTNQQAIRDFVSVTHDLAGNLEPSVDIYPDPFAPIIRNNEDRRELAMVRWGMQSSSQALFGREEARRQAPRQGERGRLRGTGEDGARWRTTNVRNTSSKHWKRWLGVENRCVVPVTRFAEPDPASKVEGGRTPNAWFASTADDPLMFFAGI